MSKAKTPASKGTKTNEFDEYVAALVTVLGSRLSVLQLASAQEEWQLVCEQHGWRG